MHSTIQASNPSTPAPFFKKSLRAAMVAGIALFAFSHAIAAAYGGAGDPAFDATSVRARRVSLHTAFTSVESIVNNELFSTLSRKEKESLTLLISQAAKCIELGASYMPILEAATGLNETIIHAIIQMSIPGDTTTISAANYEILVKKYTNNDAEAANIIRILPYDRFPVILKDLRASISSKTT